MRINTMKLTNCKLMEMTETADGFSLDNLTPFYMEKHIDELLKQAKIGLKIYKDLGRIASAENMVVIIELIKRAESEKQAKTGLIQKFQITAHTAKYLTDLPLSELTLFDTRDYASLVTRYQESIKALTMIHNLFL